jgi:hypothetical protein
MNIEIVGFYLNLDKRKKIFGTFHVYLIDFDIDLRGIPVFKGKAGYIIHFPHSTGIDEETKKPVRYPIFSFSDPEKHKELLGDIRQKGMDYLKNNIFTFKISSTKHFLSH